MRKLNPFLSPTPSRLSTEGKLNLRGGGKKMLREELGLDKSWGTSAQA
jgi:hypothetical protein